jgi:hypothetical protein
MDTPFSGSPDHQVAMQRLLPYMSPGLRNDRSNLEAVLLYLKLGGEKLARIAIDAHNQTYRLQKVQKQRLRLKQALLDEQMEAGDKEDDDEKADTLNESGDDSDDGNDDIPEY